MITATIVQRLMERLINEGCLDGPSVRGDNRLLSIDIHGITEKKRRQLERASLPLGPLGAPGVAAETLRQAWATVGAVLQAVLSALAVAIAKRCVRLP